MCIMVLQKVAQVEVKRKSDTGGCLRRNGFAPVTDELSQRNIIPLLR